MKNIITLDQIHASSTAQFFLAQAAAPPPASPGTGTGTEVVPAGSTSDPATGNAPAEQRPKGSPFGFMPMMVLFFVIMYFMIIRPQKKRQKEHTERIKSLNKGDKVVTAGGIHGTITNIKQTSVMLNTGGNNLIEFEKSSISSVGKTTEERDSKMEKAPDNSGELRSQ